jgi:hypothetical protein
MKKMLHKNFYKKALLTALTIVSAMSYAPMGYAALASYSQNFESLNAISSTALRDAGFVVYSNTYTDQGLTNLVNSTGPNPGRNDYRAYAQLASGEGDLAQGNQQLFVFSNYLSPDQSTHYIDALTPQQQTIGADDLGSTWSFSFDAKQGDIGGTSSAFAWIRAIDSGNILGETSLDTTSLGINWGSYSVSLLIDPSWNGKTLEFGVKSAATGYATSGVYYDNFSLSGPPSVPVPAAIWLFGSGLLCLVGIARRHKS